jgi:hypothetical protein
MHIPNPEDLSTQDWAMRIAELEWIRTKEKEANKS